MYIMSVYNNRIVGQLIKTFNGKMFACVNFARITLKIINLLWHLVVKVYGSKYY